jgi:hypothetical protein
MVDLTSVSKPVPWRAVFVNKPAPASGAAAKAREATSKAFLNLARLPGWPSDRSTVF